MRPVTDVLRQAPLIDGDNDLLCALREARDKGEELDPAGPCPQLHTDLPRLEAGALGGQFWSVYVPSDLPADRAVTQTFEQIDALFELLRRNPERLELAHTTDDVERIAAAGKVASMVGVEGGHAIGSSLGTLRILAAFGAGYLTLTHNDDTAWADSATGERAHGGLTRFGEEVVRELNRCGMLVDLSHVSVDTMEDALRVSEAPVIFSHSSARALCNVPRNVPDNILQLVAKNGGVVMVAFVPGFISQAVADFDAKPEAERKGLTAPRATIAQVADHIDHIRKVAGIDHIGFGADFDGITEVVLGLEDVSKYPDLTAELLKRGYKDDEVKK